MGIKDKVANFFKFANELTDDGDLLIKDVPIFKTGHLKTDIVDETITTELLHEFVAAFDEMMAEDAEVPIIIGHTKGEELPRVGYHQSLKVSDDGTELLADWVITDPTTAQDIKDKKWPHRSTEMMYDTHGDKLEPLLLRTALLGSSEPALKMGTLELAGFAKFSKATDSIVIPFALPTLEDTIEGKDAVEMPRKEAHASLDKVFDVMWTANTLIRDIADKDDYTPEERATAIQAVLDDLPTLIESALSEPVTRSDIDSQFSKDTTPAGAGPADNQGGHNMADQIPPVVADPIVDDAAANGVEIAQMKARADTQDEVIKALQADKKQRVLSDAYTRLESAGLSPAAVGLVQNSQVIPYAGQAGDTVTVQFVKDDGHDEVAPIEALLRVFDGLAKMAKAGTLTVPTGEQGKVVDGQASHLPDISPEAVATFVAKHNEAHPGDKLTSADIGVVVDAIKQGISPEDK